MPKKTTFNDLVKIMAKLRAPGGCPWDAKQTHASLLKYLKEESLEVIQAVRKNDMENLEEELADILLQVLFHSAIASEKHKFDIDDVLATLKMKLVNRHPHVFGDARGHKWTAEDVVNRWDDLKKIDRDLRKKSKREKRK